MVKLMFEQKILTNVAEKLERISTNLDAPFTGSVLSSIWQLQDQTKNMSHNEKRFYDQQLVIADSQVRSVRALLSQLTTTMQNLSNSAHSSQLVSGAFQEDTIQDLT